LKINYLNQEKYNYFSGIIFVLILLPAFYAKDTFVYLTKH